jgi:hypothetical protein
MRWIQVYFHPERMMTWLKRRDDSRTRVVVEDGNGATHIECGPSTFYDGRNCTHVFVQDGLLYRLNYPEAQVADWRVLQERLIDRMRSFQPNSRLPLPR